MWCFFWFTRSTVVHLSQGNGQPKQAHSIIWCGQTFKIVGSLELENFKSLKGKPDTFSAAIPTIHTSICFWSFVWASTSACMVWIKQFHFIPDSGNLMGSMKSSVEPWTDLDRQKTWFRLGSPASRLKMLFENYGLNWCHLNTGNVPVGLQRWEQNIEDPEKHQKRRNPSAARSSQFGTLNKHKKREDMEGLHNLIKNDEKAWCRYRWCCKS